MSRDLAIVLPVLIPIATAAITACLWNSHVAQKRVGLVSLFALLCSSFYLLAIVADAGVVAKQFGAWKAPFGISFVADPLSAALVTISGILGFCVGVFALRDVSARHQRNGFHPLYHGLLAAVNGAFLTGDIFNLYVWFEVMLVTSIGLLVIGRTRDQVAGALKYAALNLFGTILFLSGVALLYGATGTLNMAHLAQILPNTQMSPGLMASAMLLLCGFAIKMGLFPVFFWLPASYPSAPIAVGALFAGLLTKVGVYAAFRVFTLLFTVEASGLRETLAVIAALTMLVGVFGAVIQWDMRRILTFHIISQIGYMLMGLAIATPLALAGGIFYVVHHIIVKANLFLLAGAIYHASGTHDLRKSGGLLRSHPWLAVLFLIPALSLAGLPPFSGFWAKFLVIDATMRDGAHWLAAVALLAGILTLFSMTKIWNEAFWKTPALVRKQPRRVPMAFVAPIAALGAITMAIGLFAEPFVTYSRAAAAVLVDTTAYVAAVFPAPAISSLGGM
jgi:multicomponent Na+:H+ antiporter subunit D